MINKTLKLLLLSVCLIITFNIKSFAESPDDLVKIKVLNGYYNNSYEHALIALEFNIKPEWKIYDNQPQEVGLPTKISFINVINIADQQIFFPESQQFPETMGLKSSGYKGHVIIPIKIFPDTYQKTISGKLKIDFAICKEICLFASEELDINLPFNIHNETNLRIINQEPTSNSLWSQLPLMLIFAFIAGFILNFMPCVLPVLMLKIMKFLNNAGKDQNVVIYSSLASLFGIITSFLVIALFTIILKSLGMKIGWGLHFQEPLFLISLAIIIMIFAANIFGYFTVSLPHKINNFLSKLTHHKNIYLDYFLTGIFATILATPCSAPFMGPAIIFAITNNFLTIIMIFLAMGLGLGLPYILLIIYPNILTKLPKPGLWMDKLKYVLGILLLLTVLWLLWVLSDQIGDLSTLILFGILVAIFQILKFQFSATHLFGIYVKKIFIIFLIIAGFVIPIKLSSTPIKNIENNLKTNWINFNQQEISEYVKQDKVIFVNVTANWCITCKFNKLFILNQKKVINAFQNNNIIAMEADYTNRDEEIYNFLQKHNRYGIPFYIIFSKSYPEGIPLPEVITSKIIINNLKKANE